MSVQTSRAMLRKWPLWKGQIHRHSAPSLKWKEGNWLCERKLNHIEGTLEHINNRDAVFNMTDGGGERLNFSFYD